ncbi:zinc ribbon domain-containing protein [Ornithinibacillus californiensis]|uniref:zinc ribbon domain-containing protein n=1 Tax=Ornithinibacillus californiensis TaxID=161536 RepID=UPI00064D9AD5|nr:zinc ribbon domain-containing protein [Ornithinibacillus californiensis]
MKCQHCGHVTVEGKFCSHCGASMEVMEHPMEETSHAEDELESPLTEDEGYSEQEIIQPINSSQSQGEQKHQEKKKDFSDQFATIFTNFGHFFMTLIKKPSMAKKANHHDMYSAIITIIAFALVISLSVFLPAALYSRSRWFMAVPSVFYEFIVPLILLIILFAGFVSLTYAATKITKVELSFADVIGKYGAYLLPFGLLFVAGVILSIGQLPILPSILLTIGILGPIFVVPTLILFEKEGSGLDKIYTLLGLYFTELLLIVLFSNSLFGRVIGELFYFLN